MGRMRVRLTVTCGENAYKNVPVKSWLPDKADCYLQDKIHSARACRW